MLATALSLHVPLRQLTLIGLSGRLSRPESPEWTERFLLPKPQENLSSSVVKTKRIRYRSSRLPSFFEELTASSHCLLVMKRG